MSSTPRGALCAALLALLVLEGCAAPLSQREAVGIAGRSLAKFCRTRADCQPLRLSHAQKIKDRWLIEYDSPANQFGVAVERDGNTDISVWDKRSGVSTR